MANPVASREEARSIYLGMNRQNKTPNILVFITAMLTHSPGYRPDGSRIHSFHRRSH